jgi:hypothetical protein
MFKNLIPKKKFYFIFYSKNDLGDLYNKIEKNEIKKILL